jgi:hypothetical protein
MEPECSLLCSQEPATVSRLFVGSVLRLSGIRSGYKLIQWTLIGSGLLLAITFCETNLQQHIGQGCTTDSNSVPSHKHILQGHRVCSSAVGLCHERQANDSRTPFVWRSESRSSLFIVALAWSRKSHRVSNIVREIDSHLSVTCQFRISADLSVRRKCI